MNLHDIHFALTNVAIWLTVVGGNGRTIGDHLWVIEEGTPPEYVDARETWNRNYWTPSRFQWRPFQYHGLFSAGFVPPLCGRRSQARRPRIQTGWGNVGCERCTELARQRGIIPLTYTQAQQASTQFLSISAEASEWTRAGRPTVWPLPSPTT